jgi:hypothetical protein
MIHVETKKIIFKSKVNRRFRPSFVANRPALKIEMEWNDLQRDSVLCRLLTEISLQFPFVLKDRRTEYFSDLRESSS